MSKQSLLGLVTEFNKVIEKSFPTGLIVYCLGSSFQLKNGKYEGSSQCPIIFSDTDLNLENIYCNRSLVLVSLSPFFILICHLITFYNCKPYKKKKHKKITPYRKSVMKEPTVKRCLLILHLKPLRS